MNKLLAYFLLTVLLLSGSISLNAQTLKVGVILPLHDDNGDGRRMVEYYRGLLMGCDSLRSSGMSIGVRAWNLPENGNPADILRDPEAAKCDVIFGPLYSKQVKELADFAKAHQQKLVIPFSTVSNEVSRNSSVFQVFQNMATLNESVVKRFMEQFKKYHPVIIDCNDTTATSRGAFTTLLRQRLDAAGIGYNITNLNSPDEGFAKAFAKDKHNIVVLNSARESALRTAMAKLNTLKHRRPEAQTAMFGYVDWLTYAKTLADDFYTNNVYIPSTYYYNDKSSATRRFLQKYRWNFHQDMLPQEPHFAITGFDHAYYFLRGIYIYGKGFTGAKGTVRYEPIQTPLEFTNIKGGGMQNRSLLIVHYMPERRIETIK